jgi:hypothetical protein
MSHIVQPYFRTAAGNHYYPGATAEGLSHAQTVERYDHIAASGARASTLVGPRAFMSVTFDWITDAVMANLITWWDEVKGGSEFDYVLDDSIVKFDGSWDFDGTETFGTDIDGNPITTTTYTIENTELVFTAGRVHGYWTLTLRLREAV